MKMNDIDDTATAELDPAFTNEIVKTSSSKHKSFIPQ